MLLLFFFGGRVDGFLRRYMKSRRRHGFFTSLSLSLSLFNRPIMHSDPSSSLPSAWGDCWTPSHPQQQQQQQLPLAAYVAFPISAGILCYLPPPPPPPPLMTPVFPQHPPQPVLQVHQSTSPGNQSSPYHRPPTRGDDTPPLPSAVAPPPTPGGTPQRHG